MKAVERDRFVIGFLCALALHGVIVLLLGFVDLEQGKKISTTLPPVAVRFEIPDFLPQEELEEPEASEASEAPEPEVVEEPEAADLSEAQELPEELEALPSGSPGVGSPGTEKVPVPADSGQAAAGRSTGRVRAPGDGYTIPQPSADARRRAEMEFEQGPRSRTPSRASREESPASRSLEGTESRPVSAEEESERSEGSRVIYAERSDDSSDRGDSPVNRRSDGERADSERGSILSGDLLSELDRLGSTGSGTGSAHDTPPGDSPNGSSPSTRIAESYTRLPSETGSGEVAYSLEEGHQTRRLLEYALPDLSDEQLSRLPGTIEVSVAFSLQPNGVPLEVYLPQGASTGYPEIDNSIIAAVRNWKFTSVSGENGGSVRGRALIVIRAR